MELLHVCPIIYLCLAYLPISDLVVVCFNKLLSLLLVGGWVGGSVRNSCYGVIILLVCDCMWTWVCWDDNWVDGGHDLITFFPHEGCS